MRQAIAPADATTALRAPPATGLPTGRTSAPLGRFLAAPGTAVSIERCTLALEVRSPGRLVPWIGPAIRGITALRYRAAVCRQPREDWTGRWRHCCGCPHLPECGYGIAFEPDAGAPAAILQPSDQAIAPGRSAEPIGRIDAVRRLVIAPVFPTVTPARRGQVIEVTITSIGTQASATVPGIVDALASAGLRDGLGPDRVRFAVCDRRPAADTLVVDPGRLPALSRSDSALPRLTIRLDAPLFLRERESHARRPILEPDFRMFVRHAVRIVREFFPHLRPEMTEGHEDVAARIATAARSLAPFRQEKASRRTFRRFEMEGVVGACTFANVPGCFLPWLTLAGLLHVGGHRVAGAGGWTVLTGPADPPPGKPR